VALTKGCKSANIVRDLKDVPAGCGSTVVTSTVVIYVLVRVSGIRFPGIIDCSREFQGLVDLDLEIAKCDKKLGLAQLNLDKIAKIESQPNYEETIPANVRLTNEDKVCIDLLSRSSNLTCSLSYQRKTYEAEIATLQSSKEMFAKLK
jgi:valyl-tRNA synthetase